MDRTAIEHAQNFLILDGVEGQRRILDLECLLSVHEPYKVIDLMDELIRDSKAKLSRQIRRDKSDPRVDSSISRIFRLKMARNTISNAIDHAHPLESA